jgi:hypothetical protein
MVEQIRQQVASNNYFDAAQLLKSDFLPAHDKWMASVAALATFQQDDMKAAHADARTAMARPRSACCHGRAHAGAGILPDLRHHALHRQSAEARRRHRGTISSGDLTQIP